MDESDLVFLNRSILLGLLTDAAKSDFSNTIENITTNIEINGEDLTNLLYLDDDVPLPEILKFFQESAATRRSHKLIQTTERKNAIFKYLRSLGSEVNALNRYDTSPNINNSASYPTTSADEPCALTETTDWMKWSGNRHEHRQEIEPHLTTDNSSVRGKKISIKFKSSVWQSLGAGSQEQSIADKIRWKRRKTSAKFTPLFGDELAEYYAQSDLISERILDKNVLLIPSTEDASLQSLNQEDFVTLSELLKSIPLFQSLTENDVSFLEEECEVMTFENNAVIVEYGQRVESIYVLLSGTVSAQHIEEATVVADRGTCFSYLSCGDVIGEFSLHAEAVSDSVYRCAVSRQDSQPVIAISIPLEVVRAFLERDKEILLRWNQFKSLKVPTLSEAALSRFGSPLCEYLELAQDALYYYQMHKLKEKFQEKGLLQSVSPKSSLKSPANDSNDKISNRRRSYVASCVSEEVTDAAVETVPVHEVSSVSLHWFDSDSKLILLMSLLTLCQPLLACSNEKEFHSDNSGQIKDILGIMEEFFGVDRVGYFIVNKVRQNMLLKTLHSQQGCGIEVPLQGIAGKIAVDGGLINIADCHQHELFDKTMDNLTSYVSKQMLCVACPAPVFATTGANGGGVLQLINTLDNRIFKERDEGFAVLLGSLMGMILYRAPYSGRFEETVSSVSSPLDSVLRVCIDNLVWKDSSAVSISCTVLFSPDLIGPTLTVAAGTNITLNFDSVKLNSLPPTSQLLLQVIGPPARTEQLKKSNAKAQHVCLGFGIVQLFNSDNNLNSSTVIVPCCAGPPPQARYYFQYLVSSLNKNHMGNIVLKFPPLSLSTFNALNEFKLRTNLLASQVVSAALNNTDAGQRPLTWYLSQLSSAERERFNLAKEINLLSATSSTLLVGNDRKLIWALRYSLMHHPSMLSTFLYAVDWCNVNNAAEAIELMSLWDPPSDVMDILPLLGPAIADPRIRLYAVRQLSEIDDSQLHCFIPYLCKLLKFELYPDNALVRFLLVRSLMSPNTIGKSLYWEVQAFHSKAEYFNTGCNSAELIISYFLRYCDTKSRLELGHQRYILLALVDLVQTTSSQDRDEESFRKKLVDLSSELPPLGFALPTFSQEAVLFEIDDKKCSWTKRDELKLVFRMQQESKKTKRGITFDKGIESRSRTNQINRNKFELGAINFTLSAGMDWSLEKTVREIMTVMNKLWESAGLPVRCKFLEFFVTNDGVGIENSLPDVRYQTSQEKRRIIDDGMMVSLDELIAIIRPDDITEAHMNKLVDNSTGLEKIGGFKFGGKKYFSDSLLRWWKLYHHDDEFFLRQTAEKFAANLAAYCISGILFSLGEVNNGTNVVVNAFGDIFPRKLSVSFQSMTTATIAPIKKTKDRLRKISADVGMLPLFAVALGMPGSTQFQLFEELTTKAFTIVRRSEKLLMSLLSVGLTNSGLDSSQIALCLKAFSDNMLLAASTDGIASQTIQEFIFASLREYMLD